MGITAKQEYFFPKDNFFVSGHVGDLVGSQTPHFCFWVIQSKNKMLKSIGLDIDMILFIFLHVLINTNYIVFDVSVLGSNEHSMLKGSF